MPPEVRSGRWAAFFALLSPLLLLLACYGSDAANPDELVQGPGGLLLIPGLLAPVLTFWVAGRARRGHVRFYRTLQASIGLTITALAIAYTVIAAHAYAAAVAQPAARTFVVRESCGSKCVHNVFIRADGSDLLGGERRAPLDYADVCAKVQLLYGRYSFAWLRVLDHSRGGGRGRLLWPVRASECFSDTPLSELPR